MPTGVSTESRASASRLMGRSSSVSNTLTTGNTVLSNRRAMLVTFWRWCGMYARSLFGWRVTLSASAPCSPIQTSPASAMVRASNTPTEASNRWTTYKRSPNAASPRGCRPVATRWISDKLSVLRAKRVSSCASVTYKSSPTASTPKGPWPTQSPCQYIAVHVVKDKYLAGIEASYE